MKKYYLYIAIRIKTEFLEYSKIYLWELKISCHVLIAALEWYFLKSNKAVQAPILPSIVIEEKQRIYNTLLVVKYTSPREWTKTPFIYSNNCK